MNVIKEKKLAFLRWVSITIIALIAMYFVEMPFNQNSAKEAIGAISNCFVVPGIIFTGLGGLTFIGHLGGYDSFGYMISNFSLHSLIPGKHPKKYGTFYEYKEAKDKKGRKWLPELLITGLINIGVGIIFLVIYAIL